MGGGLFFTARVEELSSIYMVPPSSLAFASWKGTLVGLCAAVQRGPSEAASCASKKGNRLPATSFCARPSTPSPPSLCAAPRLWPVLAPSQRRGAAAETLQQRPSCAPHL